MHAVWYSYWQLGDHVSFLINLIMFYVMMNAWIGKKCQLKFLHMMACIHMNHYSCDLWLCTENKEIEFLRLSLTLCYQFHKSTANLFNVTHLIIKNTLDKTILYVKIPSHGLSSGRRALLNKQPQIPNTDVLPSYKNM